MKDVYIIIVFAVLSAIVYWLCCWVNPFLGVVAIPIAIKIFSLILEKVTE